ncbi:MAG: molybdate ABC transporter substrate-binding protein [Thiotrichales bacterium]|nr:molybdate ABC transporter substrate-binding protein [Thiotrichales bacterium]
MMPRPMHFGVFRALAPVFALTPALAVLAVSIALPARAVADEPPLVAAAASLRHVFPALSRAWVDTGGVRPEVSFGSSGNLYRQIVQGAPFDLFLSADEEQAQKLVAAGKTDGDGIVYGFGRLALLVPKHSRLALDPTLADLARALDDGRLRRLAIANPAHAPYGRAAREALVGAALWPRLGDRLLFAENAAQAVQFALAHAADGGIVPWALVLSERVSRNARHALLDTAMHAPVAHRMVLLAPATPPARALFRFLAGPEARAIFERFGFTAPEATPQ